MRRKSYLKIKITPYKQFFANYLKNLGFKIQKDPKECNVLHEFGGNWKFILNNIKKFKPDLIILHKVNIPPIALKKQLYAYIPNLESEKDLAEEKVCYTNCPSLMKKYLKLIRLNCKIYRLIYQGKRSRRILPLALIRRLKDFSLKLRKQIRSFNRIKEKLMID